MGADPKTERGRVDNVLPTRGRRSAHPVAHPPRAIAWIPVPTEDASPAPLAPEETSASDQTLAAELLESLRRERDDVVRALELATRAQAFAIQQRDVAIKERDDVRQSQDDVARLFDARVAAGIEKRTEDLRQRYNAVEQALDAAKQDAARLTVTNTQLASDLTKALERVADLEALLAKGPAASPFKAGIAPTPPTKVL